MRHSDVVTSTDLGLDNNGIKHVGHDIMPGISLTGDGKQTALRLQAVLSNEWIEGNPGQTVITIQGSDPLNRQLYGPHKYDIGRSNEIIAGFNVQEDQGGLQSMSGCEVTGNGRFTRISSPEGHGKTSRPIQHLPEAEQASAELESVIATVNRALAS